MVIILSCRRIFLLSHQFIIPWLSCPEDSSPSSFESKVFHSNPTNKFYEYWLVVWLPSIWHFPILIGKFIIIPIDELHHFSEGWPNHQPMIFLWLIFGDQPPTCWVGVTITPSYLGGFSLSLLVPRAKKKRIFHRFSKWDEPPSTNKDFCWQMIFP